MENGWGEWSGKMGGGVVVRRVRRQTDRQRKGEGESEREEREKEREVRKRSCCSEE